MVLAVVYCVCKQIMAFQAACKRFVCKPLGHAWLLVLKTVQTNGVIKIGQF